MNSMSIVKIIILILISMLSSVCCSTINDEDTFTLNITMKGYESLRADQIVYIPYKLADEEFSIIGYYPLVNMNTTHHMDTFACETINSKESFWEGQDGIICGAGKQMLLYGWDRDALPLRFPEGIGIAVGKNTPYKYLVVNIHYLPIVKNDYSGNQLILKRKRAEYLAGVMLAGTNDISLSPKTHNIKTPFSCSYNGVSLSIFAAGVHAHRWARVNSLYRVRNGQVTLIIKGDPQQTRQSYRLSSSIDIQNGDYLIGQCVYDNDDEQTITVGPTHDNEMCNVMIGYSYKLIDDEQMKDGVPIQYCWGNLLPHLISLLPADSEIPPKSSLKTFESDLNIYQRKTRNLYISVMIGIVLTFALCVIIMIKHFFCQNSNIYHRISFQLSQYSIFKNFFHRNNGFQQLTNVESDQEDEFVI